MSRWRWGIANLFFLSTVINYIDRQTLSVLAPTLTKVLAISEQQYANIPAASLDLTVLRQRICPRGDALT